MFFFCFGVVVVLFALSMFVCLFVLLLLFCSFFGIVLFSFRAFMVFGFIVAFLLFCFGCLLLLLFVLGAWGLGGGVGGGGGVEENSEAVMDAGEGGRFCQSKSPTPPPTPRLYQLQCTSGIMTITTIVLHLTGSHSKP